MEVNLMVTGFKGVEDFVGILNFSCLDKLVAQETVGI
jgi:hypothetical protein